MKNLTLIWMAAGVLLARDGDGIRPRPSARDYAASETAVGELTVAASVISPEQVKHMFATDLNHGYIVVELAVYPESGRAVELSQSDFVMKIGGGGDMIRPASPRTIASALHRSKEPKPGSGRDVSVYPSGSIGYESGTWTDPNTGQRRRDSGVYTGAGVGVGLGDQGPQMPRAGSTERDRVTVQQELEDKTLPEGKANHAVAGYLFFPKPSGKQKNALYEISYFGDNAKLKVAVPPPSK